ncbi:MAG: ATP-binding protein [Clostridiales bacterium]|jgi:DNA replication protein DnaC|nr:ATP-binding protein [Clostridiales bacterium]
MQNNNYRQKAITLAERWLQERREHNAEQQQVRINEIYKKYPDILEFDDKIKSIGLKLIKQGANAKVTSIKTARKEINELITKKHKLMDKYGLTDSNFDPTYTCEICKDSGVTPENKYCQCREQLIRKAMYSASGLSSIEFANFDDFDLDLYSDELLEHGVSARDNAKSILDYAKSFNGGNIMFYGRTGIGKTFIASCIANEFAKSGGVVCYLSSPRMFTLLDNNKFGRDESDQTLQIIDLIYNADLLVIDDLGTEFRTAFTDTYLFDIINSRILGNKSTIISTNLQGNQLASVYSDRVASRVIGEYKAFNMFGEDIRIKKKLAL